MFNPEFELITHQRNVIRVRAVRFGRRELTHEQRARGQWAALMIRVGVEWGFPPMVLGAQRIHHALSYSGLPFEFRAPDSKPETDAFLAQMIRDIERALEVGRLVVTEGAMPLLGIPPVFELTERKRPPPLEPQPPPQRPRVDPERITFFEARFVDEVGEPIQGLEVEFTAGGSIEKVKTNPAGVAVLEDTTSMSASVSVLDADALGTILEPRWETPRPGKAPTGVNTQRFGFSGAPIAGIGLKPAVPNTIVITPPLGKLFVELLDKTGRVRHAEQSYEITGPTSFSGKTDEQGRLLHEDVPSGDYRLTLLVEVETPSGKKVERHTVPLFVTHPLDPEPQIRQVGAVPRVHLARLRGLFFETNKSFVVPGAVRSLKRVRQFYAQNNPSELLIVGHTDTTGESDVNDPLSLERAESMAAYLGDEVGVWLDRYESGTPAKRRWGRHEDLLMIEAMSDSAEMPPAEDPVRWFQRTRGLQVDGDAGTETRTQLITEYMALDGATLTASSKFDIKITAHGCGENFPLDESGNEIDSSAPDQAEDKLDRRVELFFFGAEFGIDPPPPGQISKQGSTEYPTWRDRARPIDELFNEHVNGLVVEWSDDLNGDLPEDLELTAEQDGTIQAVRWAQGTVEDGFRRLIFSKIVGNEPVTLTAESKASKRTLVLWNQQPLGDPDKPPVWQNLLEHFTEIGDVNGEFEFEIEGELPSVSDLDDSRPPPVEMAHV